MLDGDGFIVNNARKQQIIRLVLTLLLTIPCIYFNCLMQVYVHKQSSFFDELPPDHKRLPDVGFDLFSKLRIRGPWDRGPATWPQLWALSFTVITFIRIALMPRYRWTVYRRYFLTFSVMLVFRGYCLVVTMLPCPYFNCQLRNEHSVFYEALLVLIGKHVSCYDFLYTGQAIGLTLCALVWHTYAHEEPIFHCEIPKAVRPFCILSTSKRFSLARLLAWCAAVFGYGLTIATHYQYTVDVVLASCVTGGFWFLYHTYIHSVQARHNLLGVVIFWMERGSMDMQLQLETGWDGSFATSGSQSNSFKEKPPIGLSKLSVDQEQRTALLNGNNDEEMGEGTPLLSTPNSDFSPRDRDQSKNSTLGLIFHAFIHKQAVRFYLTLLLWFPCMYFNCVMQAYAERRASYFRTLPKKYQVLPDLGHRFFPHIVYVPYLGWLKWADLFVFGFMALTLVRFVLPRLPKCMKIVILRRWIMCQAALFFLRGISIIVTMLPNPFEDCVPNFFDSAWREGLLIFTGEHVTCADVLFSGHTVNITLACCVWHTYAHWPCYIWLCSPCAKCSDETKKLLLCDPLLIAESAMPSPFQGTPWQLSKIVAWSFAICGYFLIVASHFHYSLDVTIGLTLTLSFWFLYHYKMRTSHISKTALIKVLRWIEAGAPDLPSLTQTQ